MEQDCKTGDHLFATKKDIVEFWVGVGLSVASSVFIGVSFIIKKRALLRLRKRGKRANKGGFGYLKDYRWWSGLISMAVGEILNFVAYTFAPASVVSTLGVLSVLVTTVLSSKFLQEKLNVLGKVGCFLCALGSTVIVLHAPKEREIASMKDLELKIGNPMFIVYVNAVVAISLVLLYHFRIKYPDNSIKTLLIWIGVCSMIGSLSVMSCKGFGLALETTISGTKNELTNWVTWFCMGTLVICVAVQMNFLNKALDTFNTAVVTPIYYVMFTTCVIIASSILFREFDNLALGEWIGLICGFLTILTAVFILNFSKYLDFNLASLSKGINVVQSNSESGEIESQEEEKVVMIGPPSVSVTAGYGTHTQTEV